MVLKLEENLEWARRPEPENSPNRVSMVTKETRAAYTKKNLEYMKPWLFDVRFALELICLLGSTIDRTKFWKFRKNSENLASIAVARRGSSNSARAF